MNLYKLKLIDESAVKKYYENDEIKSISHSCTLPQDTIDIAGYYILYTSASENFGEIPGVIPPGRAKGAHSAM